MSRFLPYPILARSALLLWLLLNQSLSPGHRAVGNAHRRRRHMGVRRSATRKAPDPPAGLDSPARGLCLRGHPAVEHRGRGASSSAGAIPGENAGFLSIPLTLRDRYGLSVLACIITSTPGSIWVNYDTVRGVLLIHVLDLVDEEVWIRTIKDRYERLLLEIFE